jgi:hypothetical protein
MSYVLVAVASLLIGSLMDTFLLLLLTGVVLIWVIIPYVLFGAYGFFITAGAVIYGVTRR